MVPRNWPRSGACACRKARLRRRTAARTSAGVIMLQPTAFLKTGPISTKILVHLDEDEVLKAILPTTSVPHRRALPTFFEALALWLQRPVHVVLSAAEAEAWSRLGLVDGFVLRVD